LKDAVFPHALKLRLSVIIPVSSYTARTDRKFKTIKKAAQWTFYTSASS